jgi:predicted transposase/invertase (TIGR01784 family)
MNDLQPHDQFFKQIFSEPKRVKSLLDIFYPELSQKIDLESIRLLNSEKYSHKIGKSLLDLLYECKIENEKSFIRIIFEHKSYIDKNLPSQLLYYNGVLWEELGEYPPIINIVLYHGKRKWNISTTLPKTNSEIIERFSNKLNYHLIDLSKVADEEMINKLYIDFCTASALLTMKHIFEDIKKYKHILKKVFEHYQDSCVFIILDYISVVNNPQEVENVLKEILGGEKEMMTLTEKWKMEGLQQGLQQGLIKAKQEDILKLINLKFGRVSEEVEKSILEINDLEELDKLFTKAVLANSLEELLKRD